MPVDRSKLVVLVAAAVFAACGSGDPGEASALGGRVLGLTATGLVLQLNETEEVSVAAGATDFSIGVFVEGADYDVRVKAQPNGQTCSVFDGQGKMGSSSHSMVVYCSSEVHKVGGTVSGLAEGESATLTLNGEPYVLASAGTFWFPTMVPYQAKYQAVVTVAPAGKECAIASAGGTMDHDDVAAVEVLCTSLCGNHRLDSGERCDPTAPDSPSCTSSCQTPPVCGNVIPEGDEQCDTGASVDPVACPYGQATCSICGKDCKYLSLKGPFCGDGTVQSSIEQCDSVYSFACGTCGQPSDPAASCRVLSTAKASGSLTFGSSASDLVGTTFTLNPVSRGAVVFEFSTTAAVTSGHVAIDIYDESASAFRSISEIASSTVAAVRWTMGSEISAIAATSSMNDTSGGSVDQVRVLLTSGVPGIAGNSDIPVSLGNATVSLTSKPMTGGRGCAAGQRCAVNADCVSSACASGVCRN